MRGSAAVAFICIKTTGCCRYLFSIPVDSARRTCKAGLRSARLALVPVKSARGVIENILYCTQYLYTGLFRCVNIMSGCQKRANI